MDLGLTGATVVVSGFGGIGRAVARVLADEGASVVVVDRSAEAVNCATEHSVVFEMDLSEHTSELVLTEAIAKLGRPIAGLVNCSGTSVVGDPLEIGVDDLLSGVNGKFLPYMVAIRASVPHFAPAGGAIVNVAGIGGVEPFPSFIAGGAANAALLLATKALSRRLAGQQIRVNALSPSMVNTPWRQELLVEHAQRDGVPIEDAAAKSAADIPLGRAAEPSEIGSVIAFLLSPLAAYITGSHIIIDGGQTHGI